MSSPGHPNSDGKRGAPVRWALAAIIVVALATYYVIFRDGSWAFDDNFILEFARQHGFTLTWLRTPLYQHWGAGTNATFSVLLQLFPIDYRWGLAVALLGLGATIWMFARTFGLFVVGRRVVLAMTCWFAFSILWTPPLQWWTFSVQILPNIFFDLLCLYGYVRFCRDGRGRWAILSAGSMAVALLFYEKPAFMVFYLALAQCLLTGGSLRPREIVGSFWRGRRLWLSYAVVLALWGAAYISTGAAPQGSHVALGQYVSFFRLMWAQTLVPAVFGVSVPSSGLSTGQLAGVILAELAVVAAIVVTVARSRRALRAWAFLAIAVLASGVLVARSRIALFGVGVGSDPRYLMDFTWVLPFAGWAAWNRGMLFAVAADHQAPAAPKRDPKSRTRRRYAVGGAVAVLAAYVGVSVATAARLERAWPAVPARHWYQNVRRGLAQYDKPGEHPVVLDGEMPAEIVGVWEDPYGRLSLMLPVYSSSVQVDGPLVGPLLYVDGAGSMHPAELTKVWGGSFSGLVAAGRVRTAGLTGSHGCYRTSPSGAWFAATLPKPASTVPLTTTAPSYVVFHYRANSVVQGGLFLDEGSGFSDDADQTVFLTPQATESIAWLRFAALRGFRVSLPPDVTLCVGGLDVVKRRGAAS